MVLELAVLRYDTTREKTGPHSLVATEHGEARASRSDGA